MYFFKKKLSRGITLLEVLLVAVSISILISIVIPELDRIKDNQQLKSAVSDVVTAFDQARSHTLSGYNNTNWGINFDVTNNKIVLFEGSTYTDGYWKNIEIPISEPSKISNVSLSGGGSNLYFNRLTGEPSKTGIVTVTVGDISRIINITATGAVSTGDENSIFNLNVSLSGGQGTITSSPSGINCGVDCEESYVDGTNVTLSASPSACYTFSNFSGDCSGGACALTLDSAKSVTANFTPTCATYTLTISAIPEGGTITSSPSGISCGTDGVDCSEDYADITVVSLTPVPDPGYIFTSWGGYCSGSGSCNVPMTTARSVSATFSFAGYYPVVLGTNQSTEPVDDLTGIHTVLLPDNIQENDLLLVFFSVDGIPSSFTLPVGWNQLSEETTAYPYETLAIFYKIAEEGDAGLSSINITVGGPEEKSAHQSYRITNYNGVPEVIDISGSSVNPDPPSLNPALWDNSSTLWIAVASWEGSDVNLSSAPSGYSNTITTLSSSSFTGSALSTARKNRKASSEDPGVFTLASSDVWSSATVAIQGVAGGPTTYPLSIAKSGTGSGTVTSVDSYINCGATCDFDYNENAMVSLSASPSGNSVFDGWSGEGCTGAGTCEVTMSASKNVTATFTAVSQITYVGSNSGAGTTISIPAHQAGDLIVIFAYRDGNNTAPSLPSGWNNIGTADGANSNSSRLGYRVATNSSTTSGTWTNATNLVVAVYRGVSATTPTGANGNTGGNSSVVTYPGITLNQTNGTSWIVGFAGHRSIDTNLQNAPSGMTNRTTFVNATAEVAGHDTSSATASWGSTNVSIGGTSFGWRARTLEIVSQ